MWFAGTHADVGGGWPETGLSDIALLWMAERVRAKTNLAIDIDKLRRESNPDHLGLQHASSTGWYTLRRLVPANRLVLQSLEDEPSRRKQRSGHVGRNLVSLNEAIHESVLLRLRQTVKEARNGTVREIVYEPPALAQRTNAAPSVSDIGTIPADTANDKAA
jgi:hypothetical protein